MEASSDAPAVAFEPQPNQKVTTIPNPEPKALDPAAFYQEVVVKPSSMNQPSSPRSESMDSSDTLSNNHSINGDGHGKSYADAVSEPPPDDANYSLPSDLGDYSYYKKLTPTDKTDNHEKQAWEAGGIRFAPPYVPLVRRLQTAAVLYHSLTLAVLVSCFWFTCANPLAWPFLIVYLLHLSFSVVATDGSLAYRSEYMRSLPIWKLFAGYFPAKLHKTHDLSPERKYIFGYHPHGIISHGAWCAFGTNALGFAQKFPGITNTLVTLDANFRMPFYRDYLLLMGLRSVSKESIWNILTRGGKKNDGQGRGVTIVIGGARESLESQPYKMRLILKGRKGFVKMALRTGADLVPVIAFGENDLYDQLSPKQWPVFHKVQMTLLRIFKFTVPGFHGRGVLNYDMGLMPYRRPVNIVVGKPIEVGAAQAQPGQADIDRLHEQYVLEVERLWEAYKGDFAPNRTGDLDIMG